MTAPAPLPNREPSAGQLMVLADRAARKRLSCVEVHTLKLGLAALVETASEVSPSARRSLLVETQRLLAAAVALYGSAYGLSPGQAWADVRAEARR